ncbi:MAG TPA: prepilin peptidase [Pirellulales bacterium]|nr:prepilin peptidase [Pirellulales bacterium]
MNAWLAIPLPVRFALLAAVGALAGSVANWAIYALAYGPRPISPWSVAADLPPRGWRDRLPIAGWLFLRREAQRHGAGFWWRPLLLEVAMAGLFVFLYAWEVQPLQELVPLPNGRARVIGPSETLLHAQYAAQLVLIVFMMAASFIDVDEKIIPDAITVPGTLLGLALLGATAQGALPIMFYPHRPDQLPAVEPITLMTPSAWPASLAGWPALLSLGIGLGCFWLWCFALVERPWRSRRGFRTALKLCCARLVRGLLTPLMLAIELLGAAAIAAVWWLGGPHWIGLLSALVGMSAGSCLIWAVRLIGTAALRREAMGFGDVTLMGMIGAFLGWHACLLIFFIAPLAGLVVGVAQWILRRENEIPYGPFLCLAALVVIFEWAEVWNRVRHVFWLGWELPAILLICLALMAVMLRGWRFIAERWLPAEG